MRGVIEHLVAGSWTDGSASDWIDDVDPADARSPIGRVPMFDGPSLTDAVDAASQAFPAWRSTAMIERGKIMSAAAHQLRATSEQIATDITAENGKTLPEARVEVEKSADFLDYYAGLARHPVGQILDDVRRDVFVTTRREPVGVVVAITPWNDPLLTPARKLSPALISGNTTVVKPSLDTPLAMQYLARALHDNGLPAGVLNTVTGTDQQVGRHLLGDDRVAAVTFTGSTATGRLLAQQLAGQSVRFDAEMGGKNAAAVLRDADLDLAIRTITTAAFAQAGQRCTATSRVVVDRAVSDEFTGRLALAAHGLKVGPGSVLDVAVGPLVNQRQRDGVLAHLLDAGRSGATVVCGGSAPEGEELAHGFFVEPTVVADVSPEMDIWTEEVFGPVVAVLVVDGFDEAIAAVNASRYGLSSAVFTNDLATAHRFVAQADTGQVSVNLPTSGWDVHHPFGGFKESGSSFKEQGIEGLNFYSRVKTAAIGLVGRPG